MDAVGFRTDLEAKPDHLGRLADHLDADDAWAAVPTTTRRVVFLGMGSSHYAGSVAAARLRSHGIDAVAELASSDLLPPASPDTVVIAISAGGGSRETVRAATQYAGRAPLIALTNQPGTPWAISADAVVDLLAGDELGGVACRTYQHTVAMLLQLERRLTGASRSMAGVVRAAAEATADLLDRRDDWLPALTELMLGPDGTHVAAPARRLSSALQGALMLREGPRLPAVGHETGDWSHVDVYLTKTTDYRLLLFAGSRWEDELLRWCGERGSTVVAVGQDVPEASMSLRYNGDQVDDVALLTEVLVAELLAERVWSRSI